MEFARIASDSESPGGVRKRMENLRKVSRHHCSSDGSNFGRKDPRLLPSRPAMSSNAALAAQRAQAAKMDAFISQLPEHLRRPIQQQFAKLDGIGYPILTLPNEITSEIFLWCLPESLSSVTGTLGRPFHAPMLLIHICRAWRSIAISTPRLWAGLALDLPSLPKKFLTTGECENFLAEWLARAGACPLSLDFGGFDVGHAEEVGRRLVPATLSSFASHLQVLDLCIDPSDYPDYALDFHQLRRLAVGFPFAEDDEREISLRNPIQTFIAAPQLRDIFTYFRAGPSLFAIAWEQLTVFHGGAYLFPRMCHSFAFGAISRAMHF